MFKRRTLFIVGAGASKEVKFPIGADLAQIIADNMQPGSRTERATIRDTALVAEYRQRVGYNNPYSDFMAAARRIHEGVELTHSVDDFLNVHQASPLMIEVGKAAIIRAIIAAESSCDMHVDQSNIYNRINVRNLGLTWFVKLMRVLAPGSGPSAAAHAFHNVSFIVFNYDRCLEHFLEYSIAALYGIDRMKARDIVNGIRIIHPYGKIGDLDVLPFGGEKNKDYAVLAIADRIKTYAERFEERDQLRQIRDEVFYSECIVFLGFSFLEQNMALLRPSMGMKWKPVFGTALGLSDHSVKVVIEDILSTYDSSQIDSSSSIELNNKIKCSELFDYYARSLNAPSA